MFLLSWWDLIEQHKAWKRLCNQQPWPPSPAEGPGWARSSLGRGPDAQPLLPTPFTARYFSIGKQGLQRGGQGSQGACRPFAQKARDSVGHKGKGAGGIPARCWKP